MTEETITIDKNLYELLSNDSNFLEALRAAGVDNWDGYDHAWDIYREMQSEENVKH